MPTEEPFSYRKVEAIARHHHYGPDSRFVTTRLVHEEPLDVDFAEHVQRVAEMVQRCGVSDDMGDDLTISFHVSYRSEAR